MQEKHAARSFLRVRSLDRIERWLIAAMLVPTVALHPGTARAEESNFRFAYEATDSTCPPRERMLALVIARLGFDPFSDGANSRSTLKIALTRGADGFSASVSLLEDARIVGERSLRDPESCGEIAAAAALAASIIVDPTGVLKRQKTAHQASEPRVAEQDNPFREPPLAPPPASVPTRIQLFGALRAVAAVGMAPGPSIGASLDGSIRVTHFSVRLEARADLPVAVETLPDGAGARTSLLQGCLAGCYVLGPASFCGLAAAGTVFAQSEGVSPAVRDATFYAAVGVRPMLELPLGRMLFLSASIEGLIPLRRLSVDVRGVEVWRAPAVAGSAGFGFGLRFL